MNRTQGYKQTDIGEIPEDWEIIQLQNVADFSNGYAFSSRSYVNSKDNSVPVFKMGNISIGSGLKITGKEDYVGLALAERLHNYLTRENDILMCMTDMKSSMNLLGYSARIRSEKFLVNQRVGIIRPGSSIDKLFLYYYLNSQKYIDRLRTTARSGVQVNLTTEAIRESKILYPPQPEQQQIASILSALDDKIELNRKMNKTLEEMGKGLFKRWFVDFEFPDENGKPYKSSGGAMAQSELGLIPKGWKIQPLDEIAEFLNGLACQKYPPIDDEDALPVIKIADLRNGFSPNTDRASSQVEDKYHIHNGDMLFSWSGSLEVCLWPYSEGILNQHLFKVSSSIYPKWFYYFWTLEHLENFRVIASSKATTMGHIQRRHLSDAKTLVPDKAVLEKLSPSMKLIMEKQISNNKEIARLSEIRDSLLPRLMSGRLRV